MKTMRTLAAVYTVLAVVVCGWEIYTFGKAAILIVPVPVLMGGVFWQAALRQQAWRGRDSLRLVALGMLTVGLVVLATMQGFKYGADRRAAFVWEYYAFRRAVAARPEFANLDIGYTQRKGGRVYLKGSVATEAAHERLLELFERTFKNCDGGYHHGVQIADAPPQKKGPLWQTVRSAGYTNGDSNAIGGFDNEGRTNRCRLAQPW